MWTEEPLFKTAPSHVYLVAHWGREGWTLTAQAHTGSGVASSELAETYGPLSTPELLDVACSALRGLLEG